MAVPSSRTEFKEYCLRALGHPVISIEVHDDQLEDRIDEALKYYWDYHFDGSEKIYLKHAITANNRPDRIHSLTVANSGVGYSNSDTVVFTGVSGSNASASIVTDANGSILSATLANNGVEYRTAPTVSITTSGGSGASITAELGGWIEIPQNIIGVVRIFELGSAIHASSTWSVQYQMALNDMWNLTSFSLIPYYINRMHLSLIEQLLVGQKPIRYNRHRNRLHIDMNWSYMNDGEYIIVEGYQIVDPVTFTDVWGDRWLLHYTTALIKRQWGSNLKKFSGVQLLGGPTLNGKEIYDEAEEDIKKLEYEMIYTYSLPVSDEIG